jgi:hypothetical protein
MEALQLQKYDEWLADHLEELVDQYAGKVAAIHEGRVILIGNTESDIYRQVSEAGLEPMPLVFRIPREEDFQSIL